MPESRLVNRNVIAVQGRTSMRLEPEFWDALAEICRREHVTIGPLIRRIEQSGHAGGRTSAVRVYVLEYFRGRGAPTHLAHTDQGTAAHAVSAAEAPALPA